MFSKLIQNYSTKDKTRNGNLRVNVTLYPYYTENNVIYTAIWS